MLIIFISFVGFVICFCVSQNLILIQYKKCGIRNKSSFKFRESTKFKKIRLSQGLKAYKRDSPVLTFLQMYKIKSNRSSQFATNICLTNNLVEMMVDCNQSCKYSSDHSILRHLCSSYSCSSFSVV